MITHTIVQALFNKKLAAETIQHEIQELDKHIAVKLGDMFTLNESPTVNSYSQDIDDGIFERVEPEAVMPEVAAFDIDACLSAQLQLPKGDGYQQATVLRQTYDVDGSSIGVENN